MAKVGNGTYHGMSLRRVISQRCRGLKVDKKTINIYERPLHPLVPAQPFCTDHSDVTPKTCAWACLHFSSIIENTTVWGGSMAWPCPGEAKCIGNHQICDGVRDCSNGQDEDKNLCTEDFCKNGFVSYDANQLNYTKSPEEPEEYETDLSKMRYDHIFYDRYGNALRTCKK